MADSVGTYVQKVRETLNRLPLYESSFTAEDIDDSPTLNIKDSFIINEINNVQNMIVSHAKAFHIPELRMTFSGTLNDFNATEKERLLHGTVYRIDQNDVPVKCRYRDVSEHSHLESSGRNATSTYPAYTWDDNKLSIYPSPTNGLQVYYISKPIVLRNLSDTLQIDKRFDGAIVAYVSSQIYKQLDEPERHKILAAVGDRRLKNMTRKFRIGPASKAFVGPYILEEEIEIE